MEPAIIAIIGAVAGVILTNGLKLVLEAWARAEKVRDIQTALRAEIRSHRAVLEVFVDEQRRADSVAQIAGEPGFSPFVPREIEPFVFNAVLEEIHILPSAVIDPIVLYYRQWRRLAASIEDMHEPVFLALSQPRKAAVFEDYLAIGAYAVELAKNAVDAVTNSLRDENDV